MVSPHGMAAAVYSWACRDCRDASWSLPKVRDVLDHVMWLVKRLYRPLRPNINLATILEGEGKREEQKGGTEGWDRRARAITIPAPVQLFS